MTKKPRDACPREDEKIRKKSATIETMQEKVHVTLPKPYSKTAKSKPAPPKQRSKHSASAKEPVNQYSNKWLATTDIQKPFKRAVENEPSPSEVLKSLEAAMDEISHWPGDQVAGKSLDR